jgi:hypothetical protein
MAKPSPLEQARAFVSTIKPRSRCTTCALPPDQLEIVHTLQAEGTSYTALAQLVASWGRPIQHGTIYKHFEAHHHVRG